MGQTALVLTAKEAHARDACLETVVRPSWPVDLRDTLGPLRRGASDPSTLIAGDTAWRASRTPEGPATLCLRVAGAEVHAAAWGPGREWVIAGVPELIGQRDSRAGWAPPHQLIRRLDAHHPGLRVPRSRLVMEALVPGVLEQKVAGPRSR